MRGVNSLMSGVHLKDIHIPTSLQLPAAGYFDYV